MKRPFLAVTVLVLATSWTLAQGAALQQPEQSQKKSQPTASDKQGQTIEGCLSGAANTFVLTDPAGQRYELTGDTAELNANVGHKVRLYGNVGQTGGGEKITAQNPNNAFGVTKVESLSDTCK